MSPADGERTRVASIDRVELAVWRDGPPGPAVVLAHGVGSSARFVRAAFRRPVVEDLGVALVSYDLRGHGDSTPVRDPARHALDRHVADLAAVVEAVGDVAVVGGVSLGGHAAVAHAARIGGTSSLLACLPAWTGRAVPGQGPHAVVADAVRTDGIVRMIERHRRDTAMHAWLRETLVTDWSRHDAASLAAALLALDGGLAPTERELRSVRVPAVVAAWSGDPAHPIDTAREWAGWLPRGVLVEASLEAMDGGLEHLGRVAVAGLRRAGVAAGR